MAYRVIKEFLDLKDGEHRYKVGDAFPREGVEVTGARILELSTYVNKQRTPLIEEVDPEEEAPKKAKKK